MLGWEPYQNDYEDTNGQYEMNWTYAPALATADRRAFSKHMVRSIAEKHGMRATFIPKPFADLTGSGCHAHVSMWRGGANVFGGGYALGLPELAHQFLGMLAHAEALCALTNPAMNSYKRINAPVTTSSATWSPSTVSWGRNNRTHIMRVPDPGRIEYRPADGAANPYLLQAGLLAASLDGITQARNPRQPLDLDMYIAGHAVEGARRLPLNLLDAVRASEACTPLRAALREAFAASYTKLKRQEWDGYMRHLTQWECD